jgi:hypothetical protein
MLGLKQELFGCKTVALPPVATKKEQVGGLEGEGQGLSMLGTVARSSSAPEKEAVGQLFLLAP